MNKARLTLKEVTTSEKEFNILEKSRLGTVVRDIFSKLDEIEW
jgi:hypothetical protein